MKLNNSPLSNRLAFLSLARFRPGPAAAALAALGLSLFFATSGIGMNANGSAEMREFEIGRVAERDVVAERAISYVDEEATKLRREAQERLVPAVFRYSESATKDVLSSYSRFAALTRKLFSEKASAEAFKLAIQAEHPGVFSKEILDSLFRNPGRERFLDHGETVLKIILEGGIFSVPKSGLDAYNPDSVELVRKSAGRTERERIAYAKMVTMGNMGIRINEIAQSGSYPSAFSSLAAGLLIPFGTENVYYSAEDTALRLDEVRAKVEPVVKQIDRGERIIKKGFIVSKDGMARLKALGLSRSEGDGGRIAGRIISLLAVFALLLFLAGPRVVGRMLKPSEVYLLSAMTASYIIGSVFAGYAALSLDGFIASIMIPTALVVMLPTVLMGPRVAAAVAVSLPLAALFAGAFDLPSFMFALGSGISAAYALRGAERRMDLVKAGLSIALGNMLFCAGALLLEGSSLGAYAPTLFWAAFNGMACGMFVLGFLPLLEQALNAATTFRLIELSDLNSPMLKRLLTSAPGTYSHSVTVANLAESASREVGANAILARVGAYYHDIGKIDQPEYFIENQAAYNKHDELAPKMSATVIRSHVKVGIEKAHRLGLPREVVDIISEHHGNSVINWFYNEALKREDQVKVDDFAYPGSPPRSRESGIVMLADTVEAAVRTLKKPTMERLEKFVQELIMSKFETGQLAESELTFRDLEVIKNAFVRVLAGHYHSRIEYPKMSREISL